MRICAYFTLFCERMIGIILNSAGEQYHLSHAVLRLGLSGRDIDEYLQKLLVYILLLLRSCEHIMFWILHDCIV